MISLRAPKILIFRPSQTEFVALFGFLRSSLSTFSPSLTAQTALRLAADSLRPPAATSLAGAALLFQVAVPRATKLNKLNSVSTKTARHLVLLLSFFTVTFIVSVTTSPGGATYRWPMARGRGSRVKIQIRAPVGAA